MGRQRRNSEVQSQCGKKNLDRLGQSSRHIARQKWTERGQQKCGFRCFGRQQAPHHVGDQKTGADIHKHLQHQHCAVVLYAKNRKCGSQKRRISRQSDVRRGNLVGPTLAINSMLKPVLGNVAIYEGVSGDTGKPKYEENTHRDSSQRGEEKETKVLAHQLAHN